MTDDFFVMFTERGLPPRAIIEDGLLMTPVRPVAVWISDVDAWCIDGRPVNTELGDRITARAKRLGVEALSDA